MTYELNGSNVLIRKLSEFATLSLLSGTMTGGFLLAWTKEIQKHGKIDCKIFF